MAVPVADFQCGEEPADYQNSGLWLKAEPVSGAIWPEDAALTVQQTRFEALHVGFVYQDGRIVWRHVKSGDFGSHWRIGGQIVFASPSGAPPQSILMRFDRLSNHGLLRIRLVPESVISQQSAAMAAMISGALILLALSAVYSLSLAWAVRQPQLLWQGGWAVVMLLWGLLWSQMHLAILPSLAGMRSAQIGTFLSCLAISLASIAAISAPARGAIPKALLFVIRAMAVAICMSGLTLGLIRESGPMLFDQGLGYVILCDLLLIVAALFIAWTRGSRAGRDMLFAWSVPMLVLGAMSLIHGDVRLWGTGSKLVMLVAATWQALWLTAAATRRLGVLRQERDAARLLAQHAMQLAERDPLTGLYNRRGFLDRITPLLEHARAEGLPAALLLLDIDRFKDINDEFGHDVGDHILCTIGQRIERWQGGSCTTSRMGGEEFALLVIGVEGLPLRHFAESVRCGVAHCDHRQWLGERQVTVSIGVAEMHPAADFQSLYSLADSALYAAKNGGRDRVVMDKSRLISPVPPVKDVLTATA